MRIRLTKILEIATIYKIEYNAIIDVLGNNLYYFGICSKIPELLTTLMKLTHEG